MTMNICRKEFEEILCRTALQAQDHIHRHCNGQRDYDMLMSVLQRSANYLSNDPKTRVGAFDGFSLGYNHLPAGEDPLEDKSNYVHAEIDLLSKVTGDLSRRIVFVTKAPCLDCAKALVASGLKEIVYT